MAAVFFVLDVARDIAVTGTDGHLVIELCATLALVAGIFVGALHVRSIIDRSRHDQALIVAARGAMGDMIVARFRDWGLTGAEADVALFAIKGLDVAEIATLRGSAQGTVRAQLTRVYAKAGTGSQTGLIALFMEDLIDLQALLKPPQAKP